MALLNATRPTAAGVPWSPAAVSASDTISAADLGSNGAYLMVTNAGGSADTVTISDAGFTPAGNAGTPGTVNVPASSARVMYISPRAANPATQVVTVTHTSTATVSCVLIPLG